jgi:hypothetical protein
MSALPPSGQSPVPAPATYSAKPIEGRAIAALVVGLFSPIAAAFYGFPGFAAGVAAVFLGLNARSRIKKSGGVLGGSGLALAGLLVGIVGIVVGLAWGLFLLALFMAMTGTSTGKG